MHVISEAKDNIETVLCRYHIFKLRAHSSFHTLWTQQNRFRVDMHLLYIQTGLNGRKIIRQGRGWGPGAPPGHR